MFRDGRHALLEGLIDSGAAAVEDLGVAAAAAAYRTARHGEQGWAVGRFTVPAAHLEELAAVLTSTMRAGDRPDALRIAAGSEAAAQIQGFMSLMEPAVSVDAVHVTIDVGAPADPPAMDALEGSVHRAAVSTAALPATCLPVIALPIREMHEQHIAQAVEIVAAERRRSGRRLGMAVPCTAGPDDLSTRIASFLHSAAAQGTPIVVTGGVDGPMTGGAGPTPGVSNVAVAAVLAHGGAPAADLRQALTDSDTAAFAAGPAGISWRGRRIATAAILAARDSFLTGIAATRVDTLTAAVAADALGGVRP